MIDLESIKKIPSILIAEFGGSNGIRDSGGLQAAIARPYATFDLQDLYPTAIEKAAAVSKVSLLTIRLLMATKELPMY